MLILRLIYFGFQVLIKNLKNQHLFWIQVHQIELFECKEKTSKVDVQIQVQKTLLSNEVFQ